MRPGHNVASTTFQIQHIASAFRDGFLSLGRHNHDKEHPTRLSRLVSVHVSESLALLVLPFVVFPLCGVGVLIRWLYSFFPCLIPLDQRQSLD